MSIIERLDWDSSFFEMNIGRTSIEDVQTFDPITFRKEAKNAYDLVYVFSQTMLSKEHAFKAYLDLVDIIITMSIPIKRTLNPDFEFGFRTELSLNEISECYEIAEQTSVVSRFYREPLIGPERAKALYRKWIDNSLNRTYCDGILLTKLGKSISGIHVIKTDHRKKIGLCSLIGVNQNYKGMGMGKKLWEQAFTYWTSMKDIDKCIVPFSIKNTESFNFHLKIGFNRIEEIKYIYHFRNNSNTKNR
jgi:dTDP-4-amino-4,6-dideoxy-D-galactose acyltransferase